MVYRIAVFLALLGFISCGDDKGAGKMDARITADTSTTDNGGTVDTPTATTDAGVGASCGTTVCTAAQECCLGGGGQSSCVTAGTCQGVTFGCDGPEDCETNQVCCYGQQGSGSAGHGGSECKATNQCQINACHVDADCTMQGATTCCTIASTPYKVCLAQCPMM